MTALTQEIVVTAAQLAVFAGNVNDRRVITETRDLTTNAGVNPDLVTRIRYLPQAPPRLPRLIFTTFVVDDSGERVRVHDDGSPYDEELAAAGKPYRYLTEDQEFKYRGELPVWWEQAARTVVPKIPEE